MASVFLQNGVVADVGDAEENEEIELCREEQKEGLIGM